MQLNSSKYFMYREWIMYVYESFVYTPLSDQTVLFLPIKFSIIQQS